MSPAERLRLAILISGRGSNMAAIARACERGEIHARIVAVVADRETAPGLEHARGLGLACETIAAKSFPDRAAFEARLAARLDAHRPDIVVLAGFMRILGDAFVRRYRGRMLNVHPSLLPKYKGLHTHRRALEAADAHHGCSVHYVTEELDGGPVVAQTRLRVRPSDDEASLSARVQAAEHKLYPRVLGWIAANRLIWNDRGPSFDGVPLAAALVEDEDANCLV